jgi:DNA-binding NarL/FixJ family response regulator
MRISVFIADDHAVVRDSLRALLEANPDIIIVGDTGDGLQAISQVNNLHPDVVIMDISMPELNGISATQQILEASPAARVIILSMLGTPEHLPGFTGRGARLPAKRTAGREVMEAVLAVYAGETYLPAHHYPHLDYPQRVQYRQRVH